MVHQWSFLPLFHGGEAVFAISHQIDYRWFQGFQNVLVDYFYPRWIALVNQLLKVDYQFLNKVREKDRKSRVRT